MSYLMAVFMGLIQGVAEFLPISSSGHLALFQTFFGMEDVESRYMLFSVLLHFGTLLSVCVVYWRDVLEMIREFFLGLAALAGRKERQETPPAARRLVMLIVVATLPLFVMVFLKDAVNRFFSNSLMVSCALLATGWPRGAKTPGTPPSPTPCWWAADRRWRLSPASPAREPPSRWECSGALTGPLRCAFPS